MSTKQSEQRGADALQEAANQAINDLQDVSPGVTCTRAQVGTNGSHEQHRMVVVRPVSPSAHVFKMALQMRLQHLWWSHVEVVTEW